MPLYEYKCHSCGKTFEVIQKFSDEPLKTHEGCGGEVERLLSAPAFHLKGSGWYVTDYGKGNGARAGELKPAEKQGGAASESAKGETKSEAKSEPSAESKPAASESKPAPAPASSDAK